jgi:hypothetical protein
MLTPLLPCMDGESAAVLLERRFRRPTFIPRGLKDHDQRMALRLGRIQERDLLNDLLEDHQPRASRARRDFTKHRLECVAVARVEGTKLVEAGDQKVVIGHAQRVPRQSRIGRRAALRASWRRRRVLGTSLGHGTNPLHFGEEVVSCPETCLRLGKCDLPGTCFRTEKAVQIEHIRPRKCVS